MSLNSKYNKSCLSIEEVAEEIGVDTEAVKILIGNGQLSAINAAGKMVVPISAFENFLNSDLDFPSKESYHSTNSVNDWVIDILEGDDDMANGCITHVKNRWIAQLDIGKTPDGKRIRKSKSFKTKEEAENALALELLNAAPIETPKQVEIPTYEELANEFLNARNSTATPRTWDTYWQYSKYSIKFLGKMKISEITKAEVIKMFNQFSQMYRDSTLKKIKTVAGMVFDYAIEKNLISVNPAKAVRRLPKSIISASDDIDMNKALSPERFQYILNLAKDDYTIDGMIFILAYTGIRPGELRALKVSDINLEENALFVRRAASVAKIRNEEGKVTGKSEYIKDTKNGDYGHRKLKVPRFVLEKALAQHDRILANPKYKDAQKTQYLFPDVDGGFCKEFAFSSKWRRFRDKNNLDKEVYFPYVFRHTMCTNLIRKGISIPVIQRVLGDNTPDIIMKVYTHINNDDVAKAMDIVHNDVTVSAFK